MTETADLVRRLYGHCVITAGTLDLVAWVTFKAEHGVEPQQIEPVLVATIEHLCRLNLETTEEANRLSIALSSRRR